jgi:hypothetical protein
MRGRVLSISYAATAGRLLFGDLLDYLADAQAG